jgi:hypothetical protein
MFPHVYSFSGVDVIKQLKEMILALLHESVLLLPDDVVETIVDKVQFGLAVSNSTASCL